MTRGQQEGDLRDQDFVDNLDEDLKRDQENYAADLADGTLAAEIEREQGSPAEGEQVQSISVDELLADEEQPQ
jgi:hypothetical protein